MIVFRWLLSFTIGLSLNPSPGVGGASNPAEIEFPPPSTGAGDRRG